MMQQSSVFEEECHTLLMSSDCYELWQSCCNCQRALLAL